MGIQHERRRPFNFTKKKEKSFNFLSALHKEKNPSLSPFDHIPSFLKRALTITTIRKFPHTRLLINESNQ